jgi:hypothetical protein
MPGSHGGRRVITLSSAHEKAPAVGRGGVWGLFRSYTQSRKRGKPSADSNLYLELRCRFSLV